jgi:hypothetical protein
MRVRRGFFALVCLLVTVAVAGWGCANGGDGSASGPGSDASDPGGDGGAALECAPEDPLVPPESLPECEFCEGARCVPNFALEDDQIALLAPCDDTNTCVPELFVETNGNFTLERCSSVNGAEGRCMSECIPQVAEQASLLPQDICDDGWLCAPCYDPLTGEDTGACRQGCDTGPEEEPDVFTDCCDGRGSCVPADLAGDQADQLGVDTCTGDGELCAPNALANPSYIPPTCPSIGGAEGRCLPDCLPDIQAQADFLSQSTCEAGELCAPCYDPITGDVTGACGLNGDQPVDDPYVFGGCCEFESNPRGRCVPPEVVPEDRVDALSQDTCESEELCVPEPFLEDVNYQFPTCDADGSEGACVPDCLVDPLEAFFSGAEQGSCDDGDLCVPCNALGFIETGACG